MAGRGDQIGFSDRSMRWRERYEQRGCYDGLLDRCAPLARLSKRSFSTGGGG